MTRPPLTAEQAGQRKVSQQLLIAIIAGLVSALFHGSLLSGSPLSVILVCISSMPLFLAGLGWGWFAAAVAAAAGTIALLFFGGVLPAAGYLIAIAAPSAWLSRLALLSRPGEQPGSVEWYPPGRLVAAATMIGAALVLPSLASFNFSLEKMHVAIRDMFDRLLAAGKDAPGLPNGGTIDTDALAAIFVRLMPPASVVIWIATTLISLYIAGRILRASNFLKRPWPDLRMIELPRMLTLGVAASILVTFVPGIVGVIAGAVASGLVLAHTLIGLAVMHVATLPSPVRILILGGVYFALLFLGWSPLFISWPGIILAIVGLLEPRLHLRERALARMQKPPSSPQGKT